MPFHIIRNDITKVTAEAIVNTANPEVAVGAGVDRAIYEAAGAERLLAEREKIGVLLPGQAAATPAFALDAKYIIHTVGPVWQGGTCGEREAVTDCYRNSLTLARELGCASIAFPLISTGTYEFPKDEALRIAVGEISAFLFTCDMDVYLVVYDREAFVLSSKAFAGVRSFIEDREVREPSRGEGVRKMRGKRLRSVQMLAEHIRSYPDVSAAGGEFGWTGLGSMEEDVEDSAAPDAAAPDAAAPGPASLTQEGVWAGAATEMAAEETPGLEEVLDRRAENFQQMLFRLIDRSGLTDPEVYKRANLDRKLFSRIRSKADYVPSKKTALALAVALRLNLDETMDLLRRAGLALSPSSRFDLIVGYCIQHEIYDIFEINTYLFEYEQPLLVG